MVPVTVCDQKVVGGYFFRFLCGCRVSCEKGVYQQLVATGINADGCVSVPA